MFKSRSMTFFVFLAVLFNSSAFAFDGGGSIANRSMTGVSECVAGEYGPLGVERADISIFYRSQKIILSAEGLKTFKGYAKATVVGVPIDNVHGTISEEKQDVRFVATATETAMDVCNRVRAKIIDGFITK